MNMLYKTVEYAPECDDCVLFPNCINLKLCPEISMNLWATARANGPVVLTSLIVL